MGHRYKGGLTMEFIKITSKCKEDINVELKCEFCGFTEVVYGTDKDAWFDNIKYVKCLRCKKASKTDK